MPKFNANLSMMFNEVDFMERFAAAAKAGFKGVEFLFPYAYDKNQLADARAQEQACEVILFNMPPGDWNAGDRGLACDPARSERFPGGRGQGDRLRPARSAASRSTAWRDSSRAA